MGDHRREKPVQAGDSADLLLVTAALPDGATASSSSSRPPPADTTSRTFDGQRGSRIELNDSPAPTTGYRSDATGAIDAAVIRYQSALCAEAVGAMDEALRLTTDYLKSRKHRSRCLSESFSDTDPTRSRHVCVVGIGSEHELFTPRCVWPTAGSIDRGGANKTADRPFRPPYRQNRFSFTGVSASPPNTRSLTTQPV